MITIMLVLIIYCITVTPSLFPPPPPPPSPTSFFFLLFFSTILFLFYSGWLTLNFKIAFMTVNREQKGDGLGNKKDRQLVHPWVKVLKLTDNQGLLQKSRLITSYSALEILKQAHISSKFHLNTLANSCTDACRFKNWVFNRMWMEFIIPSYLNSQARCHSQQISL